MLASGGVRGLYRGYGAVLVRAFPGNAAQFSVNELLSRYLKLNYLD